MKTNSFSPVSALAGVSFAVSGVDGHAASCGESLTYCAHSSRYQARPDCNQLARVWAATKLWNGTVQVRQWERGNAGIHAVIMDGDVHQGVTVGRDRQTLGYWCNGSTRVAAKTMEAAAKRESVQFRHTLSFLPAAKRRVCRGAGTPDQSLMRWTTRTGAQRAFDLSAWRNVKTHGDESCSRMVNVRTNRPANLIPELPRQTKPIGHQIAGSNPAALTNFNRESSVRIRPGYASCGVKVTSLEMTPENGTKRVSGHWSKAVALFGSVLFAFASVAMGDPWHGTDLNRMNHANALFSALSQVESGDNDRAIGPKGERTRYQILPAVWKRFGGGANPVEPVSALRVAELVMRPRVDSFIKTQGRPPSAQEWYLLWHCPARVMSPRRSDTQKAERFANLVK